MSVMEREPIHCDFCQALTSSEGCATIHCKPFTLHGKVTFEDVDGEWATCADCEQAFIEEGWDGLLERALAVWPGQEKTIRAMQTGVREGFIRIDHEHS